MCECVCTCEHVWKDGMGEYTVIFHKYSRTVVSLILKAEHVSRDHTVHAPNANIRKDIVNLFPTIQASQPVHTVRDIF